jgi:hypothetical protein
MTKLGWKPVGFVVCSAVFALMTSACRSSDSDSAWTGGVTARDPNRFAGIATQRGPGVAGRGCPIPHDPGGEMTGPEEGKFIEMYAPHSYLLAEGSEVVLTITPRNGDASIVVAGVKLEPDLEKNNDYELGFRTDSKGNATYWLFDTDLKKSKEIEISSKSLRRSKGKAIDGYVYPGVTIYKADVGTIEFGLRVNGWSLPVKLSQAKD